MEEVLRPKGYSLKLWRKENWSKEKCHKEALLFTKRSDFRSCSKAYKVAKKNNWLDEICFHMVRERIKPNEHKLIYN